MPEGTPLERHGARDARRWPATALEDRRSRTSRSTRARRRRSTSTAWCGTTSCAAAPNVADLQVNLLPKDERKRAEPRHRQAHPPDARADRGRATARASRSPRFRPARRCCRRSSPRSTARRRATAGARARVRGDLRAHAGRRRRRLVRRGRPAAVRGSSIDREKAALQRDRAGDVARAAAWRSRATGRAAARRRAKRSRCDRRSRLPRAPRALARRRSRSLPRSAPAAAGRRSASSSRIEAGAARQSIYHKNLMPVIYVTADVAGSEESPVYAILAA